MTAEDPLAGQEQKPAAQVAPVAQAAPAAQAAPTAQGTAPAPEVPAPQATAELPPEVGRVRLPLVGAVPFALAAGLIGLSVVVFAVVLVLCVSAFRGSRPAAGRPVAASAGAAAAQPAATGQAPERLAQLGYRALMDKAEEALKSGDVTEAARCFRAAADCEEEGLNKVLLARYRLARCLAATGKYEEALSICEGLAAISRPGDELWRCAQIVSIGALGEQGDWQEYFRRMYLLRANSARYGDAGSLDRWLSYCRATARVRILLPRLKNGGSLYGRQPPAFGEAQFVDRPLGADDIVVTTGKYGDGSLQASFAAGDMHLRSDGATLGEVLQRVTQDAGLRVEYSGPTSPRVIASLDASSLEYLLEIALGSVGLEAKIEGKVLTVMPMQTQPRSEEDGMKDALWALREFLILYPESAQVPEAYYALAHVYMIQGRTKMALDQLDVVFLEFPQSEWAVVGHYLAGRAYHEASGWERAERELVMAADGSGDAAVQASAYLWAAHSQVELHKYEEAVGSFRRALANEVNEPLAPEILYSIAYCMDMSAGFPQEVEERYLEVRTRYPDSPFARLADFRLARRAFLADDYRKAANRYEYYLRHWPIDDESSRDACRDLIVSYLRTGDSVRAVLLGEIMVSTFGREAQYWQALPTVLKACQESGLYQTGLEIIDGSLAVADTPERQWTLKVARAQCLIDLGKGSEADAVITPLLQEVKDPEILETARLAQVRLWIVQVSTGPVVEVCRDVATNSRSQANRTDALALLGRYLEGAKQYDAAARAYAGYCPPAAEGSTK